MAEDTEMPVEDVPKAEAISDQDNDIEKEHKPEVGVNETESSMLEDESMPTYLSITSNVSSLKPDDSKVQMNIHDADIEDEDGKSVVEVSSGDEGQENNRAYYERRRNDHDDEDDGEYYDDSDDSHINERAGRMRYDESDEDDDIDDEEDDIEEEEEDEDSDGDIEPEQFERSSDDYVLRTSNSNLERHYKERSRSLQDLSSPRKLSSSNSKRHVYMNSEHYDQQPFSFNYNDSKRSSQSQSKYSHVTSKVKDYINDMKGLSKRSAQRKSVDKFNLNPYTVNNDQFNANQDSDSLRLNPQCRRLKNYAEYAMKNMMEDLSRGQSINISNSQVAPLLNGDDIIATDAIKHYENVEDIQETMEIDDGNAHYIQCSKQINKSNGIIDYSTNNTVVDVQIKENGASLELAPLTNGQEAVGPILDVQSLTYEDYMKGNIDNIHKPDDTANKSIIKCINGAEVTINPVNRSSNPPPIQLESMVTDQSPLKTENINEIKSNVKPQIAKIKSTMNQNRIESIEKKLDYEKVINENLELKRQIEELKKALIIKQEESKPIEMKFVAVQTEDQPRVMKHTSTTTHLQLPNKLSTSTMPEIASTLSSIEHWTDSEYSPVVSLKPPNVEHLLNSDDSTIQSSPRNLSQTSSRALWTTNRILQTLASMTPGRPIPSVVEKKVDVQGQSKDPISPLITGGQNSRKRKASDSLGTSALGPLPSKIPLTNTTDAHVHRKFNSGSDTDGAIKSAGLSHGGAAAVAATAAASQGENIQNEETQQGSEETDDDGVKCFVWHDDDGSQERSCLIQAPIALEGSTKTGIMKKPVRECGPYLLGNLEVRISEANGTLNIWGKEVSQKSECKETEVTDEEQIETMNDTENFWPKTPRAMLNNHFKCSTTKKIKTPTSVRANISRHLRSMLNRTPSPVNGPIGNHTDDMPPNLCQRNTNNCNQCHNHKRVFSPACSNHINLQMKPSCCAYSPETNIRDCGCRREHEPIMENAHCHCEIAHHRPFPPSNLNCRCGNVRRNTVCVNHLNAEEECKHAAACHRLSDSEPEDCCRQLPKKRCHSEEINSCDHRVENICCQEINARGNPHETEEVNSTINFEKSPEIPEKRNRLRGKRVRNLMEFLKSCSDCRNPETSSINSHIPETETTNTNTNTRSIPSIRVISDPSSMSFYPKHSSNLENHKGCNSCVKHAGRAAELEAELDVIRVEISKLHSRSNAMRDMLQRVLETDVNTAT